MTGVANPFSVQYTWANEKKQPPPHLRSDIELDINTKVNDIDYYTLLAEKAKADNLVTERTLVERTLERLLPIGRELESLRSHMEAMHREHLRLVRAIEALREDVKTLEYAFYESETEG